MNDKGHHHESEAEEEPQRSEAGGVHEHHDMNQEDHGAAAKADRSASSGVSPHEQEHVHQMDEAQPHEHHAGANASHEEWGPAEDLKPSTHANHTGHEEMFRRKFWVSLVLSIPVLIYSPSVQAWFGYAAPPFPGSDWIAPVLSVVIFYYGGSPFLTLAVPELRMRKPGMMTLISMAISVAFFYSLAVLFLLEGDTFWWELVLLIDVMLLGHWMEMRSVRQASGALGELAKLMPDTAEFIDADGAVKQVPVRKLQLDDLVLVRPGTNVPADGVVEAGESDINEALITGESVPVRKSVGESVIAGSINGDGSLRIRVKATGDETALAGIMRLILEAERSKSNTQVLADKAAGWLFYIAVAAAVITAVGWTIAIGFEAEVIARVATVLVIACPHALGLAIPLVVAISTSLGARNGILVRDRLALEEARLIDTVIFSKQEDARKEPSKNRLCG